jgi:type II secretory ATPase GspE/PulE/Tfp pilus assembly ATPase PilB-like protein
MTIQHTATTEMMRRMVDKGLTTLRHNGWGKVLEGRTTVEELLRVTRNSQ